MSVLTISQLNRYVKSALDGDQRLKNLFVVGEISNFVNHVRSGHFYFTLKDANSQISCVMYKSQAQLLKFNPQNGMKVICRGRVSLYEPSGAYQLYVADMQPDGVGALNLAYEQLKTKLENEGLFDNAHKKLDLPPYPRKIGVATSNIGAAVEDIKKITKRRFPLCEIVIAPTLVQGESAAPDIVNSIELLDSIDDVDIIIVGRGGGSIEDLWAFNTEQVARAVYSCNTPIISAVGHETDYTICDFVADYRAATPSAAAEIAVPDINELINRVNSIDTTINYYIDNKINKEKQRLDNICDHSVLSDFSRFYKDKHDKIDNYSHRLNSSLNNSLLKQKSKFAALTGKLDALSPLAVISRGYAIVESDNSVVKDISDVKPLDNISIKMKNGSIECTVNEVIIDE